MYSLLEIETTCCDHCGEVCHDSTVVFEDKTFCCEGCRTVFKILNESNLCTYYSMNEQAGVQVKQGVERKRFEYLLDIDVQEKLVDFKNGKVVSVTFSVPNIHCTSCVWLLENLQNIDEGILRGTVNFLKKTVTLIFDSSKTSLRNIVELLTTIGYEPNLKLEQLENSETKSTSNHQLWLKLGVAGFCFGNIMLFSFPEYLNMDQSGSSEMFRFFFGTLNILLALPVLLYSGIDYLKSGWAALSQKGINLDVPISIGMLALFGRSLYEIISGTGAGYFDSFTGFIFFLLIGKVVQQKTFDQLTFDRDYKSYLPISVLRVNEKNLESILISKLDIGNKIIVRNNELIPADSILHSEDVLIDYSFITGESEPVKILKDELVFAGGKIIGSSAELIVSKKVEQSYLTQLWENESFKSLSNDKVLTSFADRISPFFTFSVLGIALASILVWLKINPNEAFSVFTAILIVACPCALALSTPFTLGSVVNILAINGLYVRNTGVVESLSKTSAFVFDKTGTITDPSKTQVEFIGKSLTNLEEHLIASTCQQSTHPLSIAIVDTLKRTALFDPINFIETPGEGLYAKFQDQELVIGSEDFVSTNAKDATSVDTQSFFGSNVFVAINGIIKGHFRIKHSMRNGLSELLNELSAPIYLLSGDNEKEKNLLHQVFPLWKRMLFNQSPRQKLAFINSLKEDGSKVTMIGDGLNDAGALQASNFGIAVSDDKSTFSPACDAIIDANSLSNLNLFVNFSKRAFNIILFSFGLSLIYNFTGLGFAITGNLSPLVAAILMPLSSVTIMAFTTISTRFQAKHMGLKIWA